MDPVIISVILFVVPTVLCIILWFKLSSLQKQTKTITAGVDDKNLTEIVRTYMKALDKCEHDIEMMNKEFEKIRDETATFYRKVGLVRYQGFKDTGGDQSFSLALLNQNNDGFVITSLFGRDFSKMYAKKITQGTSERKLTDEERESLNQAMNS